MLIASACILSATATAHAHIRISPVGRMGTSDRVKFIQNNKNNPTVPDSPGPCANNTTRMATPLQVTGDGGSEGTLSANKEFVKPGFGGCGLVAAGGSGTPRGGGDAMGPPALRVVALSLLLLIPVLVSWRLRRRLVPAVQL